MIKNTLGLNFYYLKVIDILQNNRTYQKIKQKNKYVCIRGLIELIIMKMKIKMKHGSHRYDIRYLEQNRKI